MLARVAGDGGGLTRDAAREAARQELGRPDYHRGDPSWRQRAFEWVVDHVLDALQRAGDATPGGWLTILVAAVALAVLAWVLVRHVRRGARAARVLDGASVAAIDAAAFRARADTHAAAGRWADAVRDRMRAIARSLEERAVLDPRPGRTAAEIASDAGRMLPGAVEALRLAARTFDEVTYGHRPATAQAYAAVLDADIAAQAARPLAPERAPV